MGAIPQGGGQFVWEGTLACFAFDSGLHEITLTNSSDGKEKTGNGSVNPELPVLLVPLDAAHPPDRPSGVPVRRRSCRRRDRRGRG